MDKTLAWLWLADAVGSGCQYAQELLTLYPDPIASDRSNAACRP